MNKKVKEVIANELLLVAKDLMAGCDKLPEGGMRDNCEKKKEEKSSKKALKGDHPQVKKVRDSYKKKWSNEFNKYRANIVKLKDKYKGIDKEYAGAAVELKKAQKVMKDAIWAHDKSKMKRDKDKQAVMREEASLDKVWKKWEQRLLKEENDEIFQLGAEVEPLDYTTGR